MKSWNSSFAPQRCLRVSIWRHVQWTEQHHLADHRWCVRGRGHWRWQISGYDVHGSRDKISRKPGGQNDRGPWRGTFSVRFKMKSCDHKNSFDSTLMIFWYQVGGTEEYKICEAIKSGEVTKPVVVWCIGTCAGMFTSEVRRLRSIPAVIRTQSSCVIFWWE